MEKIRIIIPALFILCAFVSRAQDTGLKQTIKGVVIDAESKHPLGSASVVLDGAGAGAVTDSSGSFRITQVPIGRHAIQVTMTGYEPRVISGVLVTSGKEIFVT